MREDTTPYELLLIEDNPADMRLMEEAIKMGGLREILLVSECYNAEESINMLEDKFTQHGMYDFVLLDLNMPRMSGKEILRHIKADRRFSRIPVLIMTNSDYPADVAECMRLGASTYYQKPTDLSELVAFFQAIKFSLDTEHKVVQGVIDQWIAEAKKAA